MTRRAVDAVTVCVRLPKDLKTDFEAVCSKMGISMSGAFNLFAAQTVNEQKIPFIISAGGGK